jgi:hypothetical protein
MAWTTPLTAVTNAILTTAQWNASVRDNLNTTAVALATTPGASTGKWFVSETTNVIKERIISQAFVDAPETTASTTYADLTTNGPIISTLTTGIAALVFINARMSHATTNIATYASFEVTGATTTVANDNWAVVAENVTVGNISRSAASHLISLTAGSNTFRMRYRVESATNGTFATRKMQVIPL